MTVSQYFIRIAFGTIVRFIAAWVMIAFIQWGRPVLDDAAVRLLLVICLCMAVAHVWKDRAK